MNINDLENILKNNLKDRTNEFKRVFHGRGNFYEGFSFLTIDSIDKILFVTFFEEISQKLESEILQCLDSLYNEFNFRCFILQRRYLNGGENEVLKGNLSNEVYAFENKLKYQLNFLNKNIGFFADMKKGREFVLSNSKGKKVLNLFSYTCSFSVCALKGEAKEVVNVDMSKSSLNTGKINHNLNNLDTKKVKFLPHNILKSWSKIRKLGPYDLIIIDPPSFQKGSFAASKDYEKIIKRLDEFANENCLVLSCLNAPELDTNFIKELFFSKAPSFKYIRRIDNLQSFPSKDKDRALKIMLYQKA
ncbi:SAM-dependent methyltransferase [Halarcobacter mediterraneus]|uniref:SAM-dependent methyltransferase n=1 Tax=Halarcobacter mediterraneus TaxID=2023153 RepID=A0A4V1M1J5_9BACT|nr:class I SAM-dependent methyltransferase [Halarcobacter mediterraneus]RXK14096.1 SAM-dependent methyltransferase [Halarcobacter mediterraneus]